MAAYDNGHPATRGRIIGPSDGYSSDEGAEQGSLLNKKVWGFLPGARAVMDVAFVSA